MTTELFRYAAFISYSSGDARFAKRLHSALESYRIPASLGRFDFIGGGKRNRIYPVFRDREELPAGHLGERIEAALKASAALIVVCSPGAAASPWVQKEIEYFAGLGRRDRIFAIIADNAPLTDDFGADATHACFPLAFQGDTLADLNAIEPLAADARKGKDGFHNAWLKVVAGLASITPGQLIDRDRKRRREQRLAIVGGAGAMALGLGLTGAIVDASNRRADLTARAKEIAGEGRPLDAAPFALAGLPAAGDLIGVTHSDARAAVERSTIPLKIVANLGPLGNFGFSDDSRFLITVSSEGGDGGAGMLLDLRSGARIPLGMIEEHYHSPTEALRDPAFGFSPDSRFLVTRASDGAGTLRDLRSGASTPLGDLNKFGFSRDGRLLTTLDGYGAGALRDLRGGELSLSLSRIDSFGFSRDGRFLLTRDRAGAGRLRDLQGGEPIRLGALREYYGFEFSSDGRFLVTVDPSDVGMLRDLRGGAPVSLGRVRNFVFSGDGRFLLTLAMEFDWDVAQTMGTLRDLRGGAPISLGALDTFQFSRDGRFLIVDSQAGDSTLRDLHNGAQTQLGHLGLLLGLSPDGRFLVTSFRGDQTLRDLRSGATRPLGPFDSFESFGFSGDSRFLLTLNGDGVGTLRDRRGGALMALGRLGDDRLRGNPEFRGRLLDAQFGFSPDGRFLVAVDSGGEGTLRNLSAPIATGNGARLSSENCRESGHSLQPFPRSLREGREPESTNLYRRLRGRPWSPCDWRGLGAVFPNEEQGDGWFEGMRQWLRLISVRYFGGLDWRCADSTSRASAQTRSARADMCEIFSNDAILDAFLTPDDAGRAIVELDRTIRLHPRDAEVFLRRGFAHSVMEDFHRAVGETDNAREYHDRAIADFTEAIRLDPQRAAAYYFRGVMHGKWREYRSALADIDRALELERGDPLFLSGRCRLRAISGRNLELAFADCESVLRVRPNDLGALDMRALLRLRRGDFTGALEDCNTAILTNPYRSDPKFGRGVALIRLGRAAEGRADIAEATRRDSNVAARFAMYGVTP